MVKLVLFCGVLLKVTVSENLSTTLSEDLTVIAVTLIFPALQLKK